MLEASTYNLIRRPKLGSLHLAHLFRIKRGNKNLPINPVRLGDALDHFSNRPRINQRAVTIKRDDTRAYHKLSTDKNLVFCRAPVLTLRG